MNCCFIHFFRGSLKGSLFKEWTKNAGDLRPLINISTKNENMCRLGPCTETRCHEGSRHGSHHGSWAAVQTLGSRSWCHRPVGKIWNSLISVGQVTLVLVTKWSCLSLSSSSSSSSSSSFIHICVPEPPSNRCMGPWSIVHRTDFVKLLRWLRNVAECPICPLQSGIW